jgi:Ca2+-binding EF-hand superfamily protein
MKTNQILKQMQELSKESSLFINSLNSSAGLSSQFPFNKFTIEEVDNYEEKYFEWTANSNEEMHLSSITEFLQSCGIKFKVDLVHKWMIEKVKPNLYVDFDKFEDLLKTDAVLSSSFPK